MHYLQLFSIQGKWYPICLFFCCYLFFMISVFCSRLCHAPRSLYLSGSLRPSCRQCCRLKFLLFSVVDAEVGIQWEMEKRNNTASFKTLVAFYVSLVKINSGKLEARTSCSLTKHGGLLKQTFHRISACRCTFNLIVGTNPTWLTGM